MSIPFLQSTSKQDVKDFVLEVLMREANNAELERRSQGRVPFFQPAMVFMDGAQEGRAAFTRDIAHNGLGLLHSYPIQPQELNLDLNVSDGGRVRLEVDLHWCVPCGDGWYISGANILNGSVVQ